MKPTVYTVVLADGQTFLLEADFAQAASSIRVNFHSEEESDWQPLPYQVADCGHSPTAAANLAAEYFAVDDTDCMDVVSIYDPKQEWRP